MLADLEDFDLLVSGDEDEKVNKQISMNQSATIQIVEAMQYGPVFSVKSVGLQKDDYHLELQYKF